MQANKYLSLFSGEAHIWSANLSDSKDNLNYFTYLLSNDEQERAKKYRFSKDQKNFIASRGILRSLLAKYLNKPPQNIKITYGPWGKPCLAEESRLFFNVSHSKDCALYAFALDYEIGIDIEFIDRNFDLESMVLSLFSHAELNYWKELNNTKKLEFFFKFWVGIEAYLKAIGKGWLDEEHKISLNSCYVYNQLLINKPSKNDIIYPYFFNTFPSYVSALFVDGPPLEIFYYYWHPRDLQKKFPYNIK